VRGRRGWVLEHQEFVRHKVVSLAKMLDRQISRDRELKKSGRDNTSSHDSELHKESAATGQKRENSIAEMLFYGY
jgi:hypothetical protein